MKTMFVIRRKEEKRFIGFLIGDQILVTYYQITDMLTKPTGFTVQNRLIFRYLYRFRRAMNNLLTALSW